ncbi:MAG: hypothetical protein ACE5G1_10030 [bacterium]
MPIFRSEKIWRALADIWTVGYIAYLFANFFSEGMYDFLVVPLSFLYIGILGIYVSTKEFDRWYDLHRGAHPGEWFVALWTIVIFLLFGFSFYLGQEYRLAHESVAVYIAVLSVFAVTQRSKALYREAQRRKNGEENS